MGNAGRKAIGRKPVARNSGGWAVAWALMFGAVWPALATGAEGDAGFNTRVWLSPGIYSRHFDQSKNLRDGNPGLSAEVDLARDHSVLAGTYINSNRARTQFAAYAWRPLHWQVAGVDVRAGGLVGAFDGYPNYRNGGWFVAPLPMLSIEGRYVGANVSIIPTIRNRLDGALSVQLKFRVW